LMPIAAIDAIIFLTQYRLRHPADSRANGFGLALIYARFLSFQISCAYFTLLMASTVIHLKEVPLFGVYHIATTLRHPDFFKMNF